MSFQDNIAELKDLRHTLHRFPELSGSESATAERIVDFLAPGQPDVVETGVGGTGVIVVYDSGNPGPTILLRCELDALPILERNTFEYRSEHERVAHMCGHDGHMTMVAGAGKYAAEERPTRGRLVLLFQPAEETGRGAQAVLNDERFERYRPDLAFALHNLPGFPAGSIILKHGTLASASTGFIARLKGETSHAGHPERGRNPAIAATQLLNALVAMPPLETRLDQPALVTPIHLRVGREAFGTSAGSAEVMVTVRAHETPVVEQMLVRASELADGYGRLYGLDVSAEFTEEFKAVINDEDCVNTYADIASSHGFEVIQRVSPFAWSEDFGVMTHQFKGALFGLGAGHDVPGLHNSDYDFPDELLPYGLKMFRSLIDRYLR